MKTRRFRLRFRRRVRKGQQQAATTVGEIGTQAEQQLERHLFKRFERLKPIRRFVISWVGLLVVIIGALVAQNLALGSYYQTLQPVPGGIYNEGVLGRFTNASPLYATSDADASVSRLIFAGLLTYDNQGNLVGELASDYSVDTNGNTYTVHLKPGLTWHDGKPLTSADVVFTYQLIQNPDVQSPLEAGWKGVEVTAPDSKTVVFKLPGILASFPYGMTNGIVPKHILENVRPADMRSADFNTVKPIGAGPFMWQAVEVLNSSNPAHAKQQVALDPFKAYQGGEPKLQKFVVSIFGDQTQLIKAFADNQLTGVEGLTERPTELIKGSRHVIEHNIPLNAANMVFFKTTTGVLATPQVRQALVRAANVPAITKDLGYSARLVREPILIGQVGYDRSLTQPAFDQKAAKDLLTSAGWIPGTNGIRAKAGSPLTFTLAVADTAEYRKVTKHLKEQWREVGVDLKVQFLNSGEFQNTLASHAYDAILYGISIGKDPDVFVYWDSSQADIRAANRLNLSEYNNPTADAALEAGRTRLDPALRTIKYRPFLQAWQQDSPALGLYQPRMLYLTNGPVAGLSEGPMNTATDRFNNVHNWQIREARVTNP